MDNPTYDWDVLTESAKAFAELIMGSDQTDLFHEELLNHSQLLIENDKMKEEVASLKENLPFKDKYLNLQNEFRKLAAERDSLSAQVLKLNHVQAEYDRLKEAYQQTKGQLATVNSKIEDKRSSINSTTALETIYQGYKRIFERSDVDIRRIPAELHTQLRLTDGTNRSLNISFKRYSKDKWIKL